MRPCLRCQTVTVQDKTAKLSPIVLASGFLDAVTTCTSEYSAINSGVCGNSAYEVFTGTVVRSSAY